MRSLSGEKALAVIKRLARVSQGQPLTEDEKNQFAEIIELNLSFTQISELPPEIGQLTGLKWLNLSRTPISELPAEISRLTNLENLVLMHTPISELPAEISQLTNLEKLILLDTPISELPAEISQLTGLKWLNLCYTQISELPAEIIRLTNLKELDLSHTQISELPAEIIRLTNLENLDLSHTQISELPAEIGRLTNLEELDLSDTPISELPTEIGQLTQLSKLDLRGTHLKELPEAILNLSLHFVDTDEPSFFIEGINIHNTQITSPPMDLLLSNNKDKLRAWYRANRKTEKLSPLNEAKIIFLGEPSAGKTHTIQRIMQGGRDAGINPDETHGINIEKWKRGQSNLTFHLWDFGGQHIMHSMHRCFLTQNCLYVVVLRARNDSQNNTLTQQAKYWLDNIDSFAPHSSVLVAINRTSDDSGDGYCYGVNMEQLREHYKDKLTIYDPITYAAKACRRDHFNDFMDTLFKRASELNNVSRQIPEKWNDIRKHLDMINSYHEGKGSKSVPYIDEKKYQQICEDYGETDKNNQELLLTLLNELGVCFSYHETENYGGEQLEHYQVLNPEWLTTAIYAIITAGQAGANGSTNPYHSHHGQIRHKQILKLLNDAKIRKTSKEVIKYEFFEVQYILEVMRKFKLSYLMTEHGNEDTEFIPALCPKDTPKDFRPDDSGLKLSYQMKYSFLPDTVVHQLMIACVNKLNMEKCYFQGLRIDDSLSGLIAIADMKTTLDTLFVDIYDTKGKMQTWELLTDLREKAKEINQRLNLTPEGEYICVTKGRQTAAIKLTFLLNLKEKQRVSHDFQDSNGDILTLQIDEVLGMVYGEKKVKEANEQVQSGNCGTFLEALQKDTSVVVNVYNGTAPTQPENLNPKDDKQDHFETMEKVNIAHDFAVNIKDFVVWFFIAILLISIIVCFAVGDGKQAAHWIDFIKNMFGSGSAA